MDKKIIDISFVSESEKGIIYGISVEINVWDWKKFKLVPKVKKILAFLDRSSGNNFYSFAHDVQTGNTICGDISFSRHVGTMMEHTHKTTRQFDGTKSKIA